MLAITLSQIGGISEFVNAIQPELELPSNKGNDARWRSASLKASFTAPSQVANDKK